ncbi:MAG: TIGR00725 family protein [Phycisphaerales bacterium]|nr:TIGR00725 family protein [Phycisphaerales bacterium]MCB9864161.1 TIGR00725 family protein [Phycisphaerales bacterium]
MRRPQIGIMGSSEADDTQRRVAEAAGRAVARAGAALVTGGRDGVMQAAAKGCAEAGGTVIAVTPFAPMEQVNEYTHYVIPTGLGWARNVITAISGDVILVVGGAAGTLSEIAYAWMYDRPIVALSESGGWAKKLAGERIDHRREDCIIDCDDVSKLGPILSELLAKRPLKTIPPVGPDAP